MKSLDLTFIKFTALLGEFLQNMLNKFIKSLSIYSHISNISSICLPKAFPFKNAKISSLDLSNGHSNYVNDSFSHLYIFWVDVDQRIYILAARRQNLFVVQPALDDIA